MGSPDVGRRLPDTAEVFIRDLVPEEDRTPPPLLVTTSLEGKRSPPPLLVATSLGRKRRPSHP